MHVAGLVVSLFLIGFSSMYVSWYLVLVLLAISG